MNGAFPRKEAHRRLVTLCIRLKDGVSPLPILPLSQCAQAAASHLVDNLLRRLAISLLKQDDFVSVIISHARLPQLTRGRRQGCLGVREMHTHSIW